MLHVTLTEEVEKELAALAARIGEAPDEIARKALLAYMEDLEDYAIAVEAWREHDPATTVDIDELMASLGVDDLED